MFSDQTFIIGIIAIVLIIALLLATLRVADESESEFELLGIKLGWRFKRRPRDGDGGDESVGVRQQLQDVITQHNRDWLNAITTNEYRHLWRTYTPRLYFADEKRFQTEQAKRQADGVSMITLMSSQFREVHAINDGTATVRAEETWRNNYANGRQATQIVVNVYTLKKEDGHWRIDQVDFPEGSTTTWT